MIIELYVLLQILAFVIFLISWFRRDLILWVLGLIIFAVQTFTSNNIQYLVSIVDSFGNITTESIQIVNQPMMWINILFGLLCLVMFFWDIFNPDNDNINIPRI